ncbi:MAG TPA: DUF2281 domain-containing protein [Persephonella sp.]|uniref:DUF2281 domain-containing protein n=1 Tax=Persephonella marina (strain DSM 14350 / EX-H1) TaxID=123214 RepID=C0QRU6_PERMH|nr:MULTISPECIES: DUF2281 domain-containing protein [Persephonella]ACO04080.1 hypothetical protein PERMA_1626 [Persephonella marina EX-H1]HCB69137.1 DUF2281 domain-containing protein [Persephonella sp.]
MEKKEDIYINIGILPEEARNELLNYYEYLLKKYNKNKKELLKTLLSDPKGKLPENYKFNREEAHER